MNYIRAKVDVEKLKDFIESRFFESREAMKEAIEKEYKVSVELKNGDIIICEIDGLVDIRIVEE